MSRRKSARSRPSAIRVYAVPALLWVGIAVAAWFSVNQLTDKRPAAHHSAGPETSGQARDHEPSASSPPAADKTARDTSTRQTSNQPDAQAAAHADQSAPPTHTQPSTAGPSEHKADARPAPPSGSDKQSSSPAHTPNRTGDADQHAGANTPSPAPASEKDAAPKPAGSKHVARAQLTTGIKHKEPVDRVSGVVHSHGEPRRYLYYFTQIKGLSGATVTHYWWHEGALMSKVKLRIGGAIWRTYSAQRLTPDMTGSWRVVVTDGQGHTLSTAHFVYATP
ncbi:MAG: DUF2914 domain-containing protein [Salinisphaera sp.]|uniref:DUF2914 domain-containing protein n=1 Tax=Salinisphaera sp. TaxID=1914330 RepID=UPI003C7A8145